MIDYSTGIDLFSAAVLAAIFLRLGSIKSTVSYVETKTKENSKRLAELGKKVNNNSSKIQLKHND